MLNHMALSSRIRGSTNLLSVENHRLVRNEPLLWLEKVNKDFRADVDTGQRDPNPTN